MAPSHGKSSSSTSPRKSPPSKRGATRGSPYRTQRPPNKIANKHVHNQHMQALNPNGNTIYGPSPLRFDGPIIRAKEAWQNWLEICVRLRNLPKNITTWDLWMRFQHEGTIISIEIYENRQGNKDGGGRIRFIQPPTIRPFWKSLVVITSSDGGGSSTIKVELEPARRRFQIQSPIRKQIWYPERMSLTPVAVDFGFMYDETTMMQMHRAMVLPTVGQFPSNKLKFTVDLLRSRITIDFSVKFIDETGTMAKTHSVAGAYDRVSRYMLQVPLNQLQKIHCMDLDEHHWALVFSVESPPLFYRKLLKEQESHREKALFWSEFDTWLRQTDVVYDPFSLQTNVVSLNKNASVIDIGRWTTYRLMFKKNIDEDSTFFKMKNAFQDYNITMTDSAEIKIMARQPANVWSLIDPPETPLTKHWFEDNRATSYRLSFEVRYQLEVCISNGYLNEYNITKEFVDKLSKFESKKGRSILEYVAEQEIRWYDPMLIFSDEAAMEYSPSSKIPNYCAYSRKATITPSTMYFNSPTVETTNRVIRQYAAFGDRFLRVQFTDEKAEGQINSSADKDRNDEIFTRVYRTLYNGIRIGDRHYEFLAFGNSQFRQNGAYFFCASEFVSCDDIRRWMGNFDDIKVVAKYAARLGQCFSTTRAIHSVRPAIVKIDDVERNGYCFTDGVGKISSLVARMIAEDLNLPTESNPPSAFQFRMGGCKGVLVVSPDVKGQEIHIRKSQQKFTAIYNGLEIIRWSQYSTASLNRQTITILSSLGVEDEVFNRMLTEQLTNYQAAMDDKTLALDLLSRYVDDHHVTMTIATMVVNGFMTVGEPFMMSLLHLWRSWSIKLLKEKAKIIVEEGAFVLGVTDETGTLRGHQNAKVNPNAPVSADTLPQIFLQVSDKSQKGKYTVIEGICILGRNPSLHPGDLRVVQAVDVPQLHHLRDVVVFSQLGDRDVPGMCSGGDLDGDDFFILWDKNLNPPEVNVSPMNYTAVKPKHLDRPVEIHDMTKFFVQYMKNDSLPKIAHAHLAQSDYLDLGIKDPKCLELAELHSKAVDYVKSGEPAKAEKQLMPRIWPHFMEKRHKTKDQVYRSSKILGQLYDKVESVDFIPKYQAPFDGRILTAYDLDPVLLTTARQLKSKYDTAMKRIMTQHEIKTEFEVWTAFVLSRPRVGSDYKVQEEMNHIATALKARFRQNCVDAAGSDTFEILGPFVAAMYQVTHEEMQIALAECRATKVIGGREVPRRIMEPKSMPLISFPWLFYEILGRIATRLESQADVAELGLPYLTTRSVQNRTKSGPGEETDDYLETEEGIVHRGDRLDLFRPDDINSDGEEVEQPHGTYNLGPTTPAEIEDEIKQSRLEGLVNSCDVSNMRMPGGHSYSSGLDSLLDIDFGTESSDSPDVLLLSHASSDLDHPSFPNVSQRSSPDLRDMAHSLSTVDDLVVISGADFGQATNSTSLESSDYDAASEGDEDVTILELAGSSASSKVGVLGGHGTSDEDENEDPCPLGDAANKDSSIDPISQSTPDKVSRLRSHHERIIREIREGNVDESGGDAGDEDDEAVPTSISESTLENFARISVTKDVRGSHDSENYEEQEEEEEDDDDGDDDDEEEAVILGPIAESFIDRFARLGGSSYLSSTSAQASKRSLDSS